MLSIHRIAPSGSVGATVYPPEFPPPGDPVPDAVPASFCANIKQSALDVGEDFLDLVGGCLVTAAKARDYKLAAQILIQTTPHDIVRIQTMLAIPAKRARLGEGTAQFIEEAIRRLSASPNIAIAGVGILGALVLLGSLFYWNEVRR